MQTSQRSIIALSVFTFLAAALAESTPITQAAPQGAAAQQFPASQTLPSQTSVAIMEDFSARIVVAGLGGFFAWILAKCVGLLVLRRRLLAYLIVILNTHLRQYQEALKWLFAVREKTIKEGHIVKLAADYTEDDLNDLTKVRPELMRLLFRMELIRLTKLTQRMWEIEALLAGFCETLQGYKDKGAVLKVSDIDYLHRKQDRILSYIQILPSEISNINQLPIDYSGIHGAETLVTSSSAALPEEHKAPPR